MKVALYARVSTIDQNAETQLTALRRYCEARGWTVLEEYVDTMSGSTADRPRLAALMQPANLRRYEAVLVWKFDRLFRSVPHMMEALDQFRTIGVDFVSITECIDTSTPAGRMVYTMLAAVGQFERDLVIERTRAGIARARAQGKQIGRPRVEFDVSEVERLWNHGQGLSYRAIAAKMASQGVKVSASKIFEVLRNGVLKRADTVCEQP
jgi:DNA invertase Pin-like site-specific DNA recombinase